MLDNIIQTLINNPERAMEWLVAFGIFHCFEWILIIGLRASRDSDTRKIDQLREELLALRQRGGYATGS